MIPVEFQERMKNMLGEKEYEAFADSYQDDRYQGLRINPLKTDKNRFLAATEMALADVPWEENGFYYPAKERPGKHPYHAAGVYYIQEPSAMAPAAYLKAQPGERVLDLCAAPGGKSTQIAAAMRGEGLLVSNEIHPLRAEILSENTERMGIKNALVLNETPQKLRAVFGCFFDRIMVDAPCSGEGLFRKQEDACGEWSPQNVSMCAGRQDEILEEAYHMLLPGGRMVYSTCTFSPDENEGSISRLLANHPDMTIEEPVKTEGMGDGVASWYDAFATHENAYTRTSEIPAAKDIERTIRLWPHRIKGEGHFIAVLQKQSAKDMPAKGGDAAKRLRDAREEKTVSYKELKELRAFAEETLLEKAQPKNGRFLLFGEQVYLVPKHLPRLKGLRVLRAGLHLGTIKKNRFEPSHAWALALKKDMAVRVCDLAQTDERINAYLRGETFSYEGEKGWYLIAVDGYSIGWGKLTGTTMKNHYPKGLRKEATWKTH